MKVQWTLAGALVFFVITAVFAVINMDPVQVNFLFTKTTAPLILVIVFSTVLGGLMVGSYGIYRQYKLQKKIRILEQQLPGSYPGKDKNEHHTKQNISARSKEIASDPLSRSNKNDSFLE